MPNPKQLAVTWFLLRFGVAFTFIFAAVSAFFNPEPWLNYFPDFMRGIFPDMFLLHSWGAGEIILGAWLISGYRIFLPSVGACLFFIGIFIFDFHTMPIIFRNVSILCTSLALAILSYPKDVSQLLPFQFQKSPLQTETTSLQKE